MVSSVCGEVNGIASVAVYSATKAFQNSFGVALGKELEPYGVGVTCLVPGAVRGTEFRERSQSGEALFWKVPFYSKSAATVAECGVRAMLLGDTQVTPGVMNRVFLKVVQPVCPQRLHNLIAEFMWNPLRMPWRKPMTDLQSTAPSPPRNDQPLPTPRIGPANERILPLAPPPREPVPPPPPTPLTQGPPSLVDPSPNTGTMNEDSPVATITNIPPIPAVSPPDVPNTTAGALISQPSPTPTAEHVIEEKEIEDDNHFEASPAQTETRETEKYSQQQEATPVIVGNTPPRSGEHSRTATGNNHIEQSTGKAPSDEDVQQPSEPRDTPSEPPNKGLELFLDRYQQERLSPWRDPMDQFS